MSWNQSRAKARLIGSRTRAFMFGGILAASGGAGLYTETTHYLRATPVTATLLERRKECTVEYQIIGKERAIVGIKRVSRPGLRRYVGSQDVPRVLGGMGISILTTPQGVMTGYEAKKANVGGELLAYVW